MAVDRCIHSMTRVSTWWNESGGADGDQFFLGRDPINKIYRIDTRELMTKPRITTTISLNFLSLIEKRRSNV